MTTYQEFWKNLPPDVKRNFDEKSQTLEFKRGDSIYRAGDLPRGIYFIQKGLVSLLIYGKESGKEHFLRFFRSQQFFGHRSLFSEEPYHGNAIALEQTLIKLVPLKTVMEAITKHPILLRDVTMVLAKELRRMENQHVMILENQILARTGQTLVYLKDIAPDHHWTKQEIANFSASTVSTIIKAMAELESLGLIKQNGRKVEIIDREGLINLE